MQHVSRHRSSEETEEIGRKEISELIDQWIIGRNAERNRTVLKRRLIDGIVYEKLAEEFDMSVRQIKTIVYKGEETLFKHVDIG